VTDLVSRVRRRLVTDLADQPDLDVALRSESRGIADDTVLEQLRRDLQAELVGAGPLEPLLALPGVTDVLVNGADDVWLDRGAGMERAAVRFPDDAAVRRLAQRLAAAAGRRLDDAMPFADAALPDGTRLHAVLPPLAACTTLSLRVLARERHALADLIRLGTMPPDVAGALQAIVGAKLAVVISGGTGSGKTTLLGALLGTVAPDERLLVIEDAPELVIEHPHVVRLVTRTANVEGAGAVGLRELVRHALRMRPDRIVVGEFRGAEMVELLVALNTGHDGGAATLHANSAADVPARFAALGALAGLPLAAVTSLVASAVDVVLHLRRTRGGRIVEEIGLLQRGGDELRVAPVWSARGGVGIAAAELAARIAQRAVEVPGLLR
jgi:pilus assembly protein CpaF